MNQPKFLGKKKRARREALKAAAAATPAEKPVSPNEIIRRSQREGVLRNAQAAMIANPIEPAPGSKEKKYLTGRAARRTMKFGRGYPKPQRSRIKRSAKTRGTRKRYVG